MINFKKKSTVFIYAGILFGMVSCEGGIGGESIYDLDKAGEIQEIKKEIIAISGDVMAYEISMDSQGELETSIDRITIVTSEGAEEGTLNREMFQLTGTGEPSTSVIDNDFFVSGYEKNGAKKINDIDFTLVEKNINEAKKIIPAEYINHSVYTYKIEFEDNKRADSFTINTLLKGESDHMEGRNIVTNYYEFLFEVDENGAVVMVE